MKYNKRQVTELKNKKVLHKVRKDWVVVSIALLGLLGVTSISSERVHADPQTSVKPTRVDYNGNSSAAKVSMTSTSSLQSAQSASSMSLHSSSHVVHQARHLYAHILTHAMVSQSDNENHTNEATQQTPVRTTTATPSASRVYYGKWGHAQVKFVSDGEHGNGTGDLAEVGPGAISDAFNEENNSDTTYPSDQGAYVVNRYSDNLALPFDAASNNWRLTFAPGTSLGTDNGISKGDQKPSSGEDPDSVDYEAHAKQTNDYRNLFSSINRPLWDHFKTMDLTNLDTNNAINLSEIFANDRSLQTVVLNSDANPQLSDIHGMFAGDPQLQNVDLKHFGTGHVTDMDSLFASDTKLRHLDVSPLDTRNVTNMHAMFMSDLSLSDLHGINHFDTRHITNLISTFARDEALPQLALTSWNTPNVKSTAGMFSGDSQLRDLDLSGLRTAQVSDMSGMFSQDSQLRKLNLENFDTRNVQATFPGATFGGMSLMFSGDDHLHELILGPDTDLNRPNQNWGSRFFDQVYDINGNDATEAIKQGRSAAGTYYAAAYYNNVVLYQQYFADEKAILGQMLNNPQLDTSAKNQLKQTYHQVSQVVTSANDKLNASNVAPEVNDDFNTVTSLVNSSRTQTSAALTQAAQTSAANSADSSIADYYRKSVAASVSIMNSRTASKAAQSADQSIVTSYRDSVAASVSSANQSLARSYQSSVSTSVSLANSQIANSAAQSADQRIAVSYQNSVSNSVTNLNRQKASLAARSANEQIAKSNQVQDQQAASARSSIHSGLTTIEQDNQAAVADDKSATAELNRLNVGNDAKLNSLKAVDQNEIADDGALVSEDQSTIASLMNSANYSNSNVGSLAANVKRQADTASEIAQDAGLIITDDLTALSSKAVQASQASASASASIQAMVRSQSQSVANENKWPQFSNHAQSSSSSASQNNHSQTSAASVTLNSSMPASTASHVNSYYPKSVVSHVSSMPSAKHYNKQSTSIPASYMSSQHALNSSRKPSFSSKSNANSKMVTNHVHHSAASNRYHEVGSKVVADEVHSADHRAGVNQASMQHTNAVGKLPQTGDQSPKSEIILSLLVLGLSINALAVRIDKHRRDL